jgi:hypothetical protein
MTIEPFFFKKKKKKSIILANIYQIMSNGYARYDR